MNNEKKLEEIKRLCQSIIYYEADYIDDSNYEMAEDALFYFLLFIHIMKNIGLTNIF